MLGLCRRVGAFSSCSAQASHCGGLSHCGAWALGHAGFELTAHGLGALWLEIPRLGIEPMSPWIDGWILNHWTSRESKALLFIPLLCSSNLLLLLLISRLPSLFGRFLCSFFVSCYFFGLAPVVWLWGTTAIRGPWMNTWDCLLSLNFKFFLGHSYWRWGQEVFGAVFGCSSSWNSGLLFLKLFIIVTLYPEPSTKTFIQSFCWKGKPMVAIFYIR